MAKGDPKFVRLPERLVSGCLGDVQGSGWFIGGRDVQPFPDDDDPVGQNFVRTHLRAGNLEEAKESEHKTVREAGESMRKMHFNQLEEHEAHDRAGHQEAQLTSLARSTTTKLDRLRKTNEEDDEALLEEVDTPRDLEMGGAKSALKQQTAGKARQEARRPE